MNTGYSSSSSCASVPMSALKKKRTRTVLLLWCPGLFDLAQTAFIVGVGEC